MIFTKQDAPREVLQYRLDGEKYEAEFLAMEESHPGELSQVLQDNHAPADAVRQLFGLSATEPWSG